VSPVAGFAYELEGMNVLRVLVVHALKRPSGTENVTLNDAVINVSPSV
jgi:hypothetical protein